MAFPREDDAVEVSLSCSAVAATGVDCVIGDMFCEFWVVEMVIFCKMEFPFPISPLVAVVERI